MDAYLKKCIDFPNDLKKIGNGVNKRCYCYNGDSTYVLLCVKEQKKELLQDEIRQLKYFKSLGIFVPEISEIKSFDINGEDYAAVETFIEGFEIERKNGFAFNEEDVCSFANAICKFMLECESQKANNIFNQALKSMRKLKSVFDSSENFDIPDLQFRFSKVTGIIYVVDPGYSKDYGINRAAHLKWINIILKKIDDTCYLNREWNKTHPSDKNIFKANDN